MALQIMPQEFQPMHDNPCIRTKCPQALITDEMVARQVKRGNLAAGDTVLVQCMSFDDTDLLAEAEYRVISRKSELKTYEGDGGNTRQVEEATFKVQRWTEWREVEHEAVAPIAAPQSMAERYVPGEARAVWNFGKKRHDIMVGDAQVGFHKDKETANRIAAGELPLPEAV